LVIEDLDGQKSAVLTLSDDSVGGPAGRELNSGRNVGGIDVDVDGVGTTTKFARVAGTNHLALARYQGVLNVF